jgi:predicted O-methyltransferase YrrM
LFLQHFFYKSEEKKKLNIINKQNSFKLNKQKTNCHCHETNEISDKLIGKILSMYHEVVRFWDLSYTQGHWGIADPDLYQLRKVRFVLDHMAFAQQNGLMISNICEVGVMAGSSSVVMMMQAPTANWWGFDYALDTMLRTQGAGEFLQKAFPGKALLTIGDSLKTVPKFYDENPSVMCDVVFLDGGKTYDLRKGDLQNFYKMSSNKTIVFMDEICGNDYVSGHMNAKCDDNSMDFEVESRAYREAVLNGKLKIQACLDKKSAYDGFCVGNYIY